MSLARSPRRRPVPALIPGQLTPALRQRIGDAIEALLAVLDAASLDPDLEPDQDLEDDADQDASEERHHA